MSSAPHRFHFLIDLAGAAPRDMVQLDRDDARHLAVIRAGAGDLVDVVTADGVRWTARIDDATAGTLSIVDRAADACIAPDRLVDVTLLAGALTGAALDELVDLAVQAGVARIVPVHDAAATRSRIDARRARLQRVSGAAAKQSRRTLVPTIEPACSWSSVAARTTATRVVLDPSGEQHAVDVHAGGPVDVAVGGAEGLTPGTLALLVAAGWVPARLGPTIMRAQVAAAVGVAAMTARA